MADRALLTTNVIIRPQTRPAPHRLFHRKLYSVASLLHAQVLLRLKSTEEIGVFTELLAIFGLMAPLSFAHSLIDEQCHCRFARTSRYDKDLEGELISIPAKITIIG